MSNFLTVNEIRVKNVIMNICILLASPYVSIGGISRWTKHIMNYYYNGNSDDIDMDLLAMDRHLSSYFLLRIVFGIWDYSKIVCKEWTMIIKRKYDIIHICSSADLSLLKDYIMIRIAKRYHIRTILHIHIGRIPMMSRKSGIEWRLLCKIMRYVDAIITIDEMSYQVLKCEKRCKVVYIPNPLAPEIEQFVKNITHVQRDNMMILFVGHCVKTKGVYELVEACKEIPGIRVVLTGMIKEEIKTDLKAIGKNMDLEIIGEVPYDEVLRLMMQCGIFVLPSYTEGFPNVILESMACGCAIIGTAVGAIPEMIGEEDGEKCGLLVPPKDAEALKTAIYQLLDDKELTDKCRINAKQRVKRYNMDSVWNKLVALWTIQ